MNFPTNPTIGDVFEANGRRWTWDGMAWLYNGQIGPPGPPGRDGDPGQPGSVEDNTILDGGFF